MNQPFLQFINILITNNWGKTTILKTSIQEYEF
jgi:hypothetical protein